MRAIEDGEYKGPSEDVFNSWSDNLEYLPNIPKEDGLKTRGFYFTDSGIYIFAAVYEFLNKSGINVENAVSDTKFQMKLSWSEKLDKIHSINCSEIEGLEGDPE